MFFEKPEINIKKSKEIFLEDKKNNNDEIKKMRDEKNKKIKKKMPVFLTDLFNFFIPVTIVLGTIFLICFCI